MAGFDVKLLSARKDPPEIVVGGQHKINVLVDRARLQAIATEAGHSEIVLPQSIDGATVAVQVPRSVQVQYGTCPGPTTAGQLVADNLTGPRRRPRSSAIACGCARGLTLSLMYRLDLTLAASRKSDLRPRE